MDLSTAAAIAAARSALMALNNAIAAAKYVTDKSMYERAASVAMGAIGEADKRVTAERMEAERMANEEMNATAAKLFANIEGQVGAFDSTSSVGSTEFMAGWDPDGNIAVGDGSESTSYVDLYEDETATVAALHGWEGKRFAVAHDNVNNTTNSNYEAVVYSDIGDPTPGRKFGTADAGTDDDRDYEYSWTTVAAGVEEGELQITGDTAVARRIASSMFDQSAGNKEFDLPTNTVRVMISGTYHGVSGTYYCTPGGGNTCAVQKTAGGFTLGVTADATNAFTADGTWTFKPTNAESRVTEMPDTAYASYGWWLRMDDDDDDDWTASAFAQPRGTLETGSFNAALTGSATYVGGAAGKYAISAPTGGTNDAGHFTATATLTANFGDAGGFNADRLVGTIHDFRVGDDGAARDWSVSIMHEGPSTPSNLVAATGVVARTVNTTQWTIDDAAAAKSGAWEARMYETGADGVPATVLGTFYTEYGNTGKMVGGFGANKE